MRLWLLLQSWYYRQRLAHARAQQRGLERVIEMERARARYDVEHCEVMLARTDVARITRRADIVAKVQR